MCSRIILYFLTPDLGPTKREHLNGITPICYPSFSTPVAVEGSGVWGEGLPGWCADEWKTMLPIVWGIRLGSDRRQLERPTPQSNRCVLTWSTWKRCQWKRCQWEGGRLQGKEQGCRRDLALTLIWISTSRTVKKWISSFFFFLKPLLSLCGILLWKR